MAPVRGKTMKKEYDFSNAKRGPVTKTVAVKTRSTIRLDNAALAWFRDQAYAAGGGSYFWWGNLRPAKWGIFNRR
jgi:hypothetical protein